jgi:hypothetical protein
VLKGYTISEIIKSATKNNHNSNKNVFTFFD